MSYYAVFLPLKDEEKSKHYRPDHLEFLTQQAEKGNVFAKGKFTDGTGGLVIYMAESYEAVEQLIKHDPYIMNGARDYEIHEWEMTMA